MECNTPVLSFSQSLDLKIVNSEIYISLACILNSDKVFFYFSRLSHHLQSYKLLEAKNIELLVYTICVQKPKTNRIKTLWETS